MKQSTQVILFVGAAALVYYLIKRYAMQAANAIAVPIADAAIKMLLPGPVGVTGKIVLQDSGALVDPNTTPVNYDGTIRVMGKLYKVGPHDASGNWPAVAV